jgi:hypothetical protein
MDAQRRFLREHKELIDNILGTAQELRERGDYNQLTLLSAALAGVASGLMDEVNAVLEGINAELKQ